MPLTLTRDDQAFLPMNLRLTTTPEMAVATVGEFKPKTLYPYQYEDTDTSRLVELLRNYEDVEVRIRKMKQDIRFAFMISR